MFHSRPRVGRTRLSTLLSTSLPARNRSRPCMDVQAGSSEPACSGRCCSHQWLPARSRRLPISDSASHAAEHSRLSFPGQRLLVSDRSSEHTKVAHSPVFESSHTAGSGRRLGPVGVVPDGAQLHPGTSIVFNICARVHQMVTAHLTHCRNSHWSPRGSSAELGTAPVPATQHFAVHPSSLYSLQPSSALFDS